MAEVGAFLFADMFTAWQRLESPEPFEDWAVAEQKTNVPDVITTQDNRFRLLVHWLGEGCVWLKDGNSAMERFGNCFFYFCFIA